MKSRQIPILIFIILLSTSLYSCLKWAARAENKLPKETALQKEYNYKGKVIIIGAGASGLAAAKILEKNNVDYVILEATNRYGGRLKKDTTLADFPIDIGAEWIHSSPLVINVIKGKSGSEVDEELIPYKLNSAVNWDGTTLKAVSKSELNFRYNFMPESKFKNSTWYDFVNENIAKEVKHKIKYKSVVNAIDYSGKKVIVKTDDGSTYEADKVLVTVSVGVLKSEKIAFTPQITQEKKEAMKSITFEKGFKLVLKFKEKFYPDVINCKVEKGEKEFYDIAFMKEKKANILGFLCKGESAEEYYALNSEKEIIAKIIQELDQMYDGKASKLYTGDYRLENWGKYEHTKGTWIQAFQEKKSNLKILSKDLMKKVYFAGELYDPYKQMGVPGAILSGYYSIDKLLTD